MWSTNSAYKAGADLARSLPDPRISQEDLVRLLRQNIAPSFKPKKSVAEARAESWSAATGTVSVLLILVILAGALVQFPQLFNGALGELSATVLGVIPPLALNVLIGAAAVCCVLLWIANSSAQRSGRASRSRNKQKLAQAALKGANDVLQRKLGRLGVVEVPTAASAPVGGAEAPQARWGQVTPRDAEFLAAEWMRYLGEPSATVTQSSRDGGVDVISQRFLAEVKHHTSSISVKLLREFAGVVGADHAGRRGLYFALTGYTADAVSFANNAGIALYIYDPYAAKLFAANATAQHYIDFGL